MPVSELVMENEAPHVTEADDWLAYYTFLSDSDNVGRVTGTCTAWAVNKAPVKVAEFLITHFTSIFCTSTTCSLRETITEFSVRRFPTPEPKNRDNVKGGMNEVWQAWRWRETSSQTEVLSLPVNKYCPRKIVSLGFTACKSHSKVNHCRRELLQRLYPQSHILSDEDLALVHFREMVLKYSNEHFIQTQAKIYARPVHEICFNRIERPSGPWMAAEGQAHLCSHGIFRDEQGIQLTSASSG